MPQPPVVSNPNSPGWSRWIERLRVATAGRFTIIRELGRGGFACVFLAQQHQPNRRVAIKLLLPSHLDSQWALEHFRGESQKIAEWRHQAVVTIYEVHEVEDLFFFVMSYVEGAPLHDLIRKLGPLPIPVARSVLAQMGSALQYAHRQGVTHRDIKPQNVLIDVDGGAVVTDFGISKQAGGTSHTVTGMIFGTPQYIAPEQAETGANSIASDQYALGIVAYEMLTGSPPFDGVPMSVLIAHIERPVPSLRAARPDCPPELEAAVMRMLAKKPEQRFPSVAEAVHAAGGAELPDFNPERRAFAQAARELASEATSQVIDIVSIPPSIEVGESIPIEASARTLAGDPVTAGTVQWSLDNKTVATIDSKTGKLTALSPGTTTLVANIGGAEQLIRVDVVAPRVSMIQIDGPNLPMRIGERRQIRAAARSKHGLPVTGTLSWTSEHPSYVTISPDGTVAAHGAGRALLRAQMEEVVSEFWIEVAAPTVREVRITGSSGAMTVGDRRQLATMVLDESDHELRDRQVHWTSSDRRMATVSATGLVTATAPGPVTITATVDDIAAALSLAVEEPQVAHIELQKAPGATHIGDRVRLRAVARDAQGNVVARGVGWSSENASIARVEPDGSVTAVATGHTRITATIDGVTATTTFEVAGRASAPQMAAAAAAAAEAQTVITPKLVSATPPRVERAPPAAPVPAPVAARTAAPAPAPPMPVARTATAATPTPSRRWVGLGFGGGALVAAGIVAVVMFNGGSGSIPLAVPANSSGANPPAPASPAPATPSPGTPRPDSVPPETRAQSLPAQPPPVTSGSGRSGGRGTTPPAAPTLRLSAPAAFLTVGDSMVVRPNASDGSAPTNVRWTSSDPSKAVVSASGVVRALERGAVTIAARFGTSVDSVRLDVRERVVAATPTAPTTPPGAVRDTATGGAGRANANTGRASEPPPNAPPPATPDNSAADRQARQLVTDYATALASRKLDAVVALYPAMPKANRDGWKALFDFAPDLKVAYRVEDVDHTREGATLRVTGVHSFTNRDTKKLCEMPVTLQVRATQAAGAWRIGSVVQQAGPTKGC